MSAEERRVRQEQKEELNLYKERKIHAFGNDLKWKDGTPLNAADLAGEISYAPLNAFKFLSEDSVGILDKAKGWIEDKTDPYWD